MLLENKSGSEVIKSFIEIRKFGLNNILQQSHTSVRRQLSAMVKCLMSTVHLLYECLICKYYHCNNNYWNSAQSSGIVRIYSSQFLIACCNICTYPWLVLIVYVSSCASCFSFVMTNCRFVNIVLVDTCTTNISYTLLVSIFLPDSLHSSFWCYLWFNTLRILKKMFPINYRWQLWHVISITHYDMLIY